MLKYYKLKIIFILISPGLFNWTRLFPKNFPKNIRNVSVSTFSVTYTNLHTFIPTHLRTSVSITWYNIYVYTMKISLLLSLWFTLKLLFLVSFIHSFVLAVQTPADVVLCVCVEALFSVCIENFHIKVFYGEVGRNVIVFGSPPQFIFYRCRYRLYFLFVYTFVVIYIVLYFA